MRKLIHTMLFLLSGMVVIAQTQPNKPAGAVQYGQLWIAPDGNVWAGSTFDGYTNLGSYLKTDSLMKTRQKAAALDVTDFGAVGDSSTINTQAFNDAFDFAVANGFRHIYVPTGTYLVDGILDVPVDISVFGDGYNSCIIPIGDAADYVAPSGSSAVFHNEGSQSLIGTLFTPLAKNSRWIVDAALASSFNSGDIIKIADTTSYSFSGYRSSDKNGEYFTVWNVSNDTVFIDHPVSDAYNSPTATLVYKMHFSTSKLSGLRITANDDSPQVPRVIWNMVGNTKLEDLYLNGALTGNIRVSNAYNIVLDRIHSYQTIPTQPGGVLTQYGLVIGGIQNFTVSNSALFGYRHALTSGAGGVLTRFGHIYNCTMYSAASYAADLHGASSDVVMEASIMTGAQIRGRSHSIVNNTILSIGILSLKFAEIKQLDFRVLNNKIYALEKFVEIEPVTRYSGNSSGDYQPDQGGTFLFSGNILKGLKKDSATAYNTAFEVTYDRAMTRSPQARFDITNNIIDCDNKRPQEFLIAGYPVGPYYVKLGDVRFVGNRFKGSRIRLLRMGGAVIQSNTFDHLWASAIYTDYTDSVTVINNVAHSIAMDVGLSNASACFGISLNANAVYVGGNSVLNTGNATQSYRFQTVGNVILGENYFGALQPFFSGISGRAYPSSFQYKVTSLNVAPSSPTSPGTAGDIRHAADGIYICIATNTWVKCGAATSW